MKTLCIVAIVIYTTIVCGNPVSFTAPGSGRIVGGLDVNITAVPYQVSVRSYGAHICGGSILSQTVILTAGHCIYSSSKPSSYSIQYGVSKIGGNNNIIDAERVLRHEMYDGANIDYDVALIYLQKPIEFEETVQAISLPSKAPIAEIKCIASGWGVLKEGSPQLATTLQAVALKTIDQEECAFKYHPINITDRMLCAGVNAGGRDACQGDSGGPLVTFSPKGTKDISREVIGIVSWGSGCARPDYPGVYTNVYSLHQWIENHLN